MGATWPAHALIAAVALGAGALALRYGLWTDGAPGSGLFPGIACLITVGGSIAAAWNERAAKASAEREPSTPTYAMLATYLGTLLAWPFLLRPLGYALASALAMMALLRAGGAGWFASAMITALAIGGSALLFGVLLEVPLPGPGGWR